VCNSYSPSLAEYHYFNSERLAIFVTPICHQHIGWVHSPIGLIQGSRSDSIGRVWEQERIEKLESLRRRRGTLCIPSGIGKPLANTDLYLCNKYVNRRQKKNAVWFLRSKRPSNYRPAWRATGLLRVCASLLAPLIQHSRDGRQKSSKLNAPSMAELTH
jgi:hypothetical protein